MKYKFTYQKIKNFVEFPTIVGIYKIENLINHKVYIGQSKNIIKRFQKHIKQTHNIPLKRAFEKYGIENFSFEILIETYDLDYWEMFLIQLFKSINYEYGYNLTYGGEGGKLCDESIEKMKKSKKNKIPWNKGKSYHRNYKHSEETKQKISNSHKGIKHNAESRAKISKNRKGKCLGHTVSEKTRLLISIKNKNKVVSKETRAILREYALNQVHTEEERIKQHQLKSKKAEEYKEYKLNNPNSKITWNEFQSKFK